MKLTSFPNSSSSSKTNRHESRTGTGRIRSEAAFTLIEIAISLAIIAFALVAIIGVLPIGLEVQRTNREETIINHDGPMFLDAIRSGARGMDDLTNYVFGITNYWVLYNSQTNIDRSGFDGYDAKGAVVDGTVLPNFRLDSGARIIGLLGTPKRIPDYYTAPFRSNHVVAYVRAMSGPASEKFPQANAAVQDLAFSYRMIPEVVRPPAFDWNSPYGTNLQANLSDVRLMFRWPLLPNDRVGPDRQTFRITVGGRVEITNDNGEQLLYFFQPTTYTNGFPH